MKTPHKHAALIKAWAFGAEIEVKMEDCSWRLMLSPRWLEQAVYRIKPEPKTDVVQYRIASIEVQSWGARFEHNLALTFDGETGELKSAEVI